jgi:hypothetical protein
MTDTHSLLDTLHEATHRVPGVPDHMSPPAGHQGNAHHGAAASTSLTRRRQRGRAWNHSSPKPARVLVAWQQRVAAFFGQEL